MTEQVNIISHDTAAEALEAQVKDLRRIVDELDKISEALPAAEFGAATAFTDIIDNATESLNGVAVALRDGGTKVEEQQAKMRGSREMRAEFLASLGLS